MSLFARFKSTFIGLAAAWALVSSPIASARDDSVCANASEINPNPVGKGIGGTGHAPEGGIGGSGAPEHGGIGGTGDALSPSALLPESDGDTTIIGIVTGFASICVAGVEVYYDAQTPVFDNGQVAKLSSLAVGKMVMLKAERVDRRMQAHAIGIFDAVAGPVERVDMQHQQMRVLGQTVRLDANTAKQISDGVNVRVSGHRLANGEIVATRVDVVDKGALASTVGVVTAVASGAISINGTRVQLPNNLALHPIKVGTEIQVFGTAEANGLKASQVALQPLQNVLRQSNRAILEGFVTNDGKDQLTISGTELRAKRSVKSGTAKDKVVKVEMRRDLNGDWLADAVEGRSGRLFDQQSRQNGSDKGSGDRSGSSDASDGSDAMHGSGSSELSHESGSSGSSHDSGSSGSSHGSGSSHEPGSSGSSHGSGSGSSSRSSGSSNSGRSSGSGSSGKSK